MQPEWRRFLEDAGAEFDNLLVRSYGNPERERRMAVDGNVLCDLSHFGLIAVHGEDAADFLQGQFSNDIAKVDETHSQHSSYCTPKGRMLANFRVFKRADAYYLRLPQTLVQPILKRLAMYVLRAKAALEDADDVLTRIGWSGPMADTALVEALKTTEIPATPLGVLTHDELSILRVRGPHPRFEIYGPMDAVRQLWTRLRLRGAPAGANCWGLLDVLAGLPNIYPETSEAFVPQMVNLDLIGGVSFSKGCYPGQEIVARTRYLGNLKRRMYRVHLDVERIAPGQQIVDSESSIVGLMVEGYGHPDGGVDGLAVLRMESVDEQRALRLDNDNGPLVVVMPPPYPFSTDAP